MGVGATTGVGLYDCSYGPVFLNLIRYANPFSKCADVRGPPDLHSVAQQLRTTGLKEMLEMSSIEFKKFLHPTRHITEHILENVGCYLLDALDNCCL